MTGAARPLVQPEPPIDRFLSPFREFFASTTSSGILLILAAVVALVWANSPFADSYEALFDAPISIGAGDAMFTRSVHFWINDALMAVFFLLVGLEIKREVLIGELATVRTALLPVAAAFGGATLPALLFLGIAGSSAEARPGWGIPMATDIAFALGVLALLGSRVPFGLRVFLAALAIVDDLLAVIVIAVFYTADLSLGALAAAGVVVVALALANVLGVRRPIVYAALGVLLWVTVLASGVHATIAGVILALTIPARRRIDTPEFVGRARALLDRLDPAPADAAAAEAEKADEAASHDDQAALLELEDATEKVQAPMLRMEHALHPWVSFGIVPLFALANAGVRLPADPIGALGQPVVLGVGVGLIVGKLIGISLATWLVVRLGVAALPAGVAWRHVVGVAGLGGIGFTMSLFIAELAYGDGPLLALAKVGILLASIVSAGVGGTLLVLAGRRDRAERHRAERERAGA